MTNDKNKSSQSPPPHDAVWLVDDLLNKALTAGASDIHFERTAGEMQIKFRLDGVLKTVEAVPGGLAENVVARLKVLAGLLTYRNDVPQEGRLEQTLREGGGVVDRRLAIFPTIHGQRAVVRLFSEDPALGHLDQLGFSPAQLLAIEAIAADNQGLLLLTGPAGSGKSTTLAAILRHIQDRFPGRSIITLEDPVERRLEGIAQVQISPHGSGMTFPTALRSLLRQDPEVLMIGEIRDAQAARIVVEAALTGHLLMSTMHSGSPAGALLRLLEMGIEPYQVTSSVSAVINQRLVRALCRHCRRKDVAGQYEAAGCEKCLGTGFKGRLLIAEMVRLDSPLRKAILAKADLEALEGLLGESGHKNLRHAAERLVADGLTTQAEAERHCGFRISD